MLTLFRQLILYAVGVLEYDFKLLQGCLHSRGYNAHLSVSFRRSQANLK